MKYDIAIVGGGPAGAWAAVRLARAGARVVVVDGSHPREKPCGGGLTGRALQVIGAAVPAEAVAGVAIAAARFEHGQRRAVVPLRDDGFGSSLTVTSRRSLDAALLAAAVSAGATHIPLRAVDVERASHGWTLRTRGGAIDAGWLVGADGPTSLVRKRLFRAFRRSDLSLATGYFVHGATSPDVVIAFEEAPAGYLWSFPRPGHLAVGACAQADDATVEGLLSQARAWIAREVRTPHSVERYSWPIPSLDEAALAAEQCSGDGWMLVGDAAGLVDPITREGIYFALRSADLAADSLSEAAASRRYASRVSDEIYGELRRAATLKAKFFRPQFMALLLRALQSSDAIGRVMADLVAGRQPYRGLRRRLLATLELGLMLEMYRRRAA
jgi:geranylgeranyl reductase family protein